MAFCVRVMWGVSFVRWEEGEDFVKRITYHQRNISPSLFYFLLFSICFSSLWSACIFYVTDWLTLYFTLSSFGEESWLNGHLMKMRRRGGGMGNEFTIRRGIKMTRLTALERERWWCWWNISKLWMNLLLPFKLCVKVNHLSHESFHKQASQSKGSFFLLWNE